EPANVAVTAAYAAELWGCSQEEVQGQLSRNFERLFGTPP
ncbi:MAG: TatD family deoxyribonuclease, partial [Deltaproteobacteria bacterium]|nr:TatD family deoxyribonuclease [Deltaproteobacteria bacterium]